MSSAPPRSTFDVASFEQALGPVARRFQLEALAECDSTNTRLMARAEAGAASGSVLVADRQTAGRGRRGRNWHSAPTRSLVFSLLWRFPRGSMPDALSLAVGLALVRAVADLGVAAPAVKWPNDLLCQGRKLSGVLIDLQPGQPHSAVIGIGVNLSLPDDLPDDVAATAIGLDSLLPRSVSREGLLATLLSHLAQTLDSYVQEGFAGLRDEWQACHALHGKPVAVSGAENICGTCTGVGARGELLVATDDGMHSVLSGDVSLRAA